MMNTVGLNHHVGGLQFSPYGNIVFNNLPVITKQASYPGYESLKQHSQHSSLIKFGNNNNNNNNGKNNNNHNNNNDASASTFYKTNSFKRMDDFANTDQYIDPYLNLVASHHNAYIVPTKDGKTVLEISTNEVSVPEADQSSKEGTPTKKDADNKMMDLSEVSSTTMGAITLLAFLNLLGYIQTTLSSSGRRRRRSSSSPQGYDQQRQLAPPVPNFFDEVLQGLEYWQEEEQEKEHFRSTSRVDPPTRRTISGKENWSSFFSTLGQRFKLAANVMGFLANPGPSRVRRSLDESVQTVLRSKRFTSNMNLWYDELARQYSDQNGSQHSGGFLSSIMMGIGRHLLGRR